MLVFLFFVFMVYVFTWNQEGFYTVNGIYADEVKEEVRKGLYLTAGIVSFFLLLGV